MPSLPIPPFNTEPNGILTQPPHPQWKLRQGMNTDSPLANEWKEKEKLGFVDVNPEGYSIGEVYNLMISGVVPRPIAFVSSEAEDGSQNLAPFSFFNLVSPHPPLISISINRTLTRKVEKDTARNIKATKTFTVNIISEPFIEAANWTSVEAPDNVSEWDGSGLTQEPSTIVKPPRVKEAAFSMECELFQAIELAPPSTPDKITVTLIIARVKLFHIRKDIHVPGREGKGPGTVDILNYRAISRLGGLRYGRVGETFDLPKPIWEDYEEELSKSRKGN